MKLVIQRAKYAKVSVNNNEIASINRGLLIFLGIAKNDTEEMVTKLVNKVIKLRIFEDENMKMNKSIKDINGQILVVSQFTLYAECKKSGNRPSFTNAEEPKRANELYELFISKCKGQLEEVQSGVFGADMKVELINDGPVTILLEE